MRSASGHLDDSQGYCGGRGKRGEVLTRGCSKSCPERKERILKKGTLLRSSVGVLSAGLGRTDEVSCQGRRNGDWTESGSRDITGVKAE